MLIGKNNISQIKETWSDLFDILRYWQRFCPIFYGMLKINNKV